MVAIYKSYRGQCRRYGFVSGSADSLDEPRVNQGGPVGNMYAHITVAETGAALSAWV